MGHHDLEQGLAGTLPHGMAGVDTELRETRVEDEPDLLHLSDLDDLGLAVDEVGDGPLEERQ